MKCKRIFLACLLIMLYTVGEAYASSNYPQTSAQSAVVIDGSSYRVLWGKNTDGKLPMASTTKIMTALVAIENGRLDDIVTVPREAQGVEGSSIYLTAGERLTLEELLYGLMLRSGNDAATAIAYEIGMGSVDRFIALMNTTARRIGAYNTNYDNPHGLHSDSHYTTAYDLAKIAAYALKNDVFEEIVSTKYKEIPWEGSQWNRVLKNNNQLLWDFEGANGVKTGYTRRAGRCLVSAAKRDDMQLICVVLNCGPMFEESSAALEYGFRNYKSYQIVNEREAVISIPVANSMTEQITLYPIEGYRVALTEEEYKNLNMTIERPDVIEAPIDKGEVCGNIVISIQDDIIKEIPLISGSYVPAKGFKTSIKRFFEIWNK